MRDAEKKRQYDRNYAAERRKQPNHEAIKHLRWRQQTRDFIQQQKIGRSCEKCGIADFRVLDFHHLDKNGKEGGLANAQNNGWGKTRILAEIAKCQVLCSNCHRILHWEEQHGLL